MSSARPGLLVGSAQARLGTLVLAGALVLSGCGGSTSLETAAQESAAVAPSAAETVAGATPSARSSVPAVPGYQPGEIPPVPLFVLPDISALLTSPDAFTVDLTTSIPARDGITVAPASCDTAGSFTHGTTSVDLYGDGSASYTSGGTAITNRGNGAGEYDDGTVSIINYGNGAGTYTNSATGVTIVNHGNGAGEYSDGTVEIITHGNGAGDYTSSATGVTIVNYGNGAGGYTDGTITITNFGNGAGEYADRDTGLEIVNWGNGEAEVTWSGGEMTVTADPLPEVPVLGSFPSLDAIAPIESCGTVVTLRDSVLFDFGSAELRPEARAILAELAQVLKDASVPAAQVFGHTDSISDETFNQTLSEQRAQAVVAALEAAGAPTSFEATGLGESAPIAPNENEDGSDNPAGRQLNRRVEIFIPAF